VDVSSADILDEVDETLRAAGITLCVTEMKVPGQGKLKRFGLYTLLERARFSPRLTIPSAVMCKVIGLIWRVGRTRGAVSDAAVATG